MNPAWFNLNPVDPAAAIAQLETEGFVAYERDCPPVPFQLPFDWLCDPFRDRNWKLQLHAWRMLDGYMRSFDESATAHDSFAKCVAVIDDWTLSTVAEQRDNDFTWYDLAIANRALKLARLAMAAPQLGHESGMAWPITPLRRAMIERHLVALRDPAKLTQGNHGFYQLHGLMALNWAFPDIATDELCHDYASTQLNRLLQFQFSESGVHLEDAPWYHFFSANGCRKIVSSPWWSGHVPPEADALLVKAEVAKSWLVAPDHRCVPIGDSPDAVVPDDVDHLLERPHQSQGRFVGSRLDGYGIVRSLPDCAPEAGSYLLMQAGFHRHGHKHSDCLSFVWWENGEYLLIDPGRYGYQPGAWRDCLMSTRSHNAVEIDGQDYERALGHAYGSALQAVEPVGGDAWSMVARHVHGELNVDHERRLTYLPGRGLVVVDHLKNLEQGLRNFTLWWHPNAGHRLDGALRQDGFTVDIGHGRRLVATFAVSAPEVVCAPLTFHGALEPRRHGWWSPGYLRVEPATVVGCPFHSDEDITVVTLFEIVAGDDSTTMAIARHDKGFKVSGWGEAPLIIGA